MTPTWSSEARWAYHWWSVRAGRLHQRSYYVKLGPVTLWWGRPNRRGLEGGVCVLNRWGLERMDWGP
jgi:hypothetical protein